MFQKALTFSYDDGITQDKQLVDIFNAYGIKAAFNLNTGIQTRQNHFTIDGNKIYRMDQDEIGDLYQGHEIAAHGLTHASPTGLTAVQLDQEYGQDILNIQRLYGRKPSGMAYAYGSYDDRVISWLKEHGIRYGRTTEVTHAFSLPQEPLKLAATCHHDDEELFSLAERFVQGEPAPGEQWLFYVWGHSYEFYVKNSWKRIERLCQLLSGKKDIFYGTNEECLTLFHVI